MPLTNYGASKDIKDILLLNNLKLNKELKHWRLEVPSYIFLNEELNMPLFTLLENTHDSFDQEGKESFFHITLVTATVLPSKTKTWKAAILTAMEKQGAIFYDLLSTALSTKGSLTLFFKLDGVYLSISSRESDLEDMYFHNLACMLQEHTQDSDFIKRVTYAIQHKAALQLSAEEHQLISQYENQRLTREAITIMEVLSTPVRPLEDLERLRAAIREKEDSLIAYRAELRRVQLLDFAISTGQHDAHGKLEDLKNYLNSIDYIIDLEQYEPKSSSAEYTFTIKSYMQIPEHDESYFKPEAINNPGHTLHKYPKAAGILKNVMLQNIRLPITASYRIKMRNNEIHRLTGVNNFVTDLRAHGTLGYVSNKHIDRFSCFDGYQEMLMEALRNTDSIGFFEIARQCTATVNVFDDAVMNLIIPQVDKYHGDLLIRRDTGWETITMEGYLNENTQTE